MISHPKLNYVCYKLGRRHNEIIMSSSHKEKLQKPNYVRHRLGLGNEIII